MWRFLKATPKEFTPRALRTGNPVYKKAPKQENNYASMDGYKQINEEDRFTTFEQWKFIPGDRIVVTKGEQKGKIGKIVGIDGNSNTFFIDTGKTKTQLLPKGQWMIPNGSHVHDFPMGIHPNEAKLVVKIDGKDVACHEVEFQGKHFNQEWQDWLPTRIIKHNNETLYLPWPTPEIKPLRQPLSNQDENSERTYYVESAVINEIPTDALRSLRNPYSKFRRGRFEERHLNKFISPEMPYSERKKQYWDNILIKRRNGHNKITPEIKSMIGGKVKKFIEEEKKNLNI